MFYATLFCTELVTFRQSRDYARKFIVVFPLRESLVPVRHSLAFQTSKDVLNALEIASAGGDPFARHAIAVHHLVIDDRRKDDEYAVSLLETIVSERDVCPIAYYTLGVCYRLGIGVKRDESKARKFFQRGAELGCYFSKWQLPIAV